MNRAYKYRLYPTPQQDVILNKTFGCARFYWNNIVSAFNSYDKETNPNPVYKTVKELKEVFDWLGEVSAAALGQKFRDFYTDKY